MHFNVYDLVYLLNSHQFVQDDIIIITELQMYKSCAVLPPLHQN